MSNQEKKRKIKQKCLELFDACGFVKAEFLKEEAKRLEKWLEEGMHDEMSYMERNKEKRLNPAKLVENAKSVIVVLLNYYPEKKQDPSGKYLISKYAYGIDYHFVVKKRLRELFDFINKEIEPIEGRIFVDSAPVLEKALAQRAGLGWIGKNSLLITKKGSYFFIGEIISTLEIEDYDKPVKAYCGDCTRCIDACPTQAIVQPYVVDSRLCISNLTIEKKPPIPEKFKGKYKQWIFGCDICQDVCPWNNKAIATEMLEFQPKKEILDFTPEQWENLTKSQFKHIFKNSAVSRRKYEGLMHNINFLQA